jgi:hypothetical protein
MRRGLRFFIGTGLAGGCLAALAVWATPVGAFDVSSSPCSLISEAHIRNDLGLTHIKETPVIGSENPTDGGVVTSACKNVILWSGDHPTTEKQLQRRIRKGTAAYVHIITFVPDPSATNAQNWVDAGYSTTYSSLTGACAVYGRLPQGHVLAPRLNGAETFSGYAGGTGTLNVCGVWGRTDSHRIIVVILEGSASKPTVRRFRKIAATAVPRFW